MNEKKKDIVLQCKHNGFNKSFYWHYDLKYWVCIKSPSIREEWQRASSDIGRYLTYMALEKNILTKDDLNLFSKKDETKKKRIISKPKNFIPLF